MIKTQDLKLQMDELTKQNDMVLSQLESVKKMLSSSSQGPKDRKQVRKNNRPRVLVILLKVLPGNKLLKVKQPTKLRSKVCLRIKINVKIKIKVKIKTRNKISRRAKGTQLISR